MKLLLKGYRCETAKCAIEKRGYAPGQHGQRRKKFSEYGAQLREKQKVKRIYGVFEKPFRNYFAHADRKKGVTGENLLRSLELRLDNVIYRMGFAPSRSAARQLVRHNHFMVNGKKVNIPSFFLKKGDEIMPSQKRLKNFLSKRLCRLLKIKPSLTGWPLIRILKRVLCRTCLPERTLPFQLKNN